MGRTPCEPADLFYSILPVLTEVTHFNFLYALTCRLAIYCDEIMSCPCTVSDCTKCYHLNGQYIKYQISNISLSLSLSLKKKGGEFFLRRMNRCGERFAVGRFAATDSRSENSRRIRRLALIEMRGRL